ncbi:MAG TPA: phosphate ABC transporter permease subunit PstC [Streptosporangiaceae bacterium]|nr:phosphate ABC transporter permease subunit PstC [Streptosporangiaceae bacterium]
MSAAAPDVVGPDGGAGLPLSRRLGRALRARVRNGDLIRWLGRAGAVIPTLALAFILGTLIVKAWPAIRVNGWHFFTGSAFNEGSFYGATVKTNGIAHPPGVSYGALPEIVGTLETSAIALLIAVPVSIGAALVIVERLPRRLAVVVGMFLEMLAGIPSVIIGLWGGFTFGPFIANHIAPFIASHVPNVPGLDFLRGPTGSGQGLLTSGLILAIMIIPIIAATARDLIRQVPLLPREGAVALGMSDWECARRVTLPWVGSGIVGASVLGLGRALGETIAVAMVCGINLTTVATNLYGAMTTIAATIVTQLDGAFQDATGFALSSFAELGLVLMVITLLVNVAARLLVRRVSGTALPVGRGL